MKTKYFHFLKTVLPLFMFMVLVTSGCVGVREAKKNTILEGARAAYARTQAEGVAANAPVATYEAEEAMKKAEQAKNAEEMKHLAYLAEKQSMLAVAVAEQKMAEKEVETMGKQQEQMVIKAREKELEVAREKAKTQALETELIRKELEAKVLEIERAKTEAQTLALQAEKARKDAEARAVEIEKAKSAAEARALEIEKAKSEAEALKLEAEQAKKEAEAKTQEAEMSRLQAEEALAHRQELEKELAELKGKRTPRGMVLTLGDILFETGKDVLLPGAMDTLDKLVSFLQKYPDRNVLVEGHTDSVGSETYNLGLSQRRANAVQGTLMAKGVDKNRISATGYGETRPVASNANPAGRQQNRRVEIVVLEEVKSWEGTSQ